MLRNELEQALNQLLRPDLVNDYCPNGLQVEGSIEINRIVTGVTASMQLIESAIKCNADTILVHHGYFWKNESAQIIGMKKARIKTLLKHDINLFAYHLPIDIHPTLGNNAQLGCLLSLNNIKALEGFKPNGIVMSGELTDTLSLASFANKIEMKLARKPTVIESPYANKSIKKVAWCTGGGQGYIDDVVGKDIDVFISGEISEQTVHSAQEQNIHFIAAGHHATERYGAKAVGEYLANEFGLDVTFIDCDNPA
ncbi:Nif3-like dinuclear metal center hexameric protein [Glaciecola sp. KUL10]|uniref:Nif3-like dinuclear metal center hexameric protein n=1 Tax=Glaciecola sp. (strain KUL10) TaxID=2161813 RepID=UPI000D78BBE9|nr:Nif3-like dinuclear metal center hexameric protein [Glaciecola sp. KUL10]GBL05372.1 metal-binding protein [Glaciecola sp. KUL10]